MLKQLILVATGGAVGCVLRFLTSHITGKYFAGHFPLATFIANMVGCFLIGVLVFLLKENSNLRLLLITGFCGGYTTFSTFSADNIALLNNNHFGLAALNIFGSIIGGLLAVWLGLTLAKI